MHKYKLHCAWFHYPLRFLAQFFTGCNKRAPNAWRTDHEAAPILLTLLLYEVFCLILKENLAFDPFNVLDCWFCVANIACHTKCKRESGPVNRGCCYLFTLLLCEKKKEGFIVVVDCKSALLAKNIARAKEEE